MKKLILTEKPSVAMDFAKALRCSQRGKACVEGPEYIIAWAIGHLLELSAPEDYSPQWKAWKFSSLPILPETILYRPIERTHQHYLELTKVLQRKDIESFIVATDAGREGELIARLIFAHAQPPAKPVYRFWTALALTPEVIRKNLQNLKSWKEYDSLYYAGKARQIADWIVGINLSRAATLKLGELYSVGRVQTAVLSFLVDRKRERELFKPEPYWHLEAHFSHPQKGKWKGLWFHSDKNSKSKNTEGAGHRILSLEDLGKIQQVLKNLSPQQMRGLVTEVKSYPKSTPPPRLFNLTELQREANTVFHFTAKETLDLAQHLYEKKKCLSYPRTDSQHLGVEDLNLVQKVMDKLSPVYPQLYQGIDGKNLSEKNSLVFNNNKVGDHHAIIPLAPYPNGDHESRSKEKKLYDLILKRFFAAFYPPCLSQILEVITEVSSLSFKSRGQTILSPGWSQILGQESSSKSLDADNLRNFGKNFDLLQDQELVKGNQANLDNYEIEKKETAPPPEYTENSLLGQMQNPSNKVEDKELKEIFRKEIGLGTESTRAQIIETLIERNYVQREKRLLKATSKGEVLVDYLRNLNSTKVLCTPEETARWEQKLIAISQGAIPPLSFLQEMKNFIQTSVRELEQFSLLPSQSPQSPQSPQSFQPTQTQSSLGPCPQCGLKVIITSFAYECESLKEKKCSFRVNKVIAGKPLGTLNMQKLLKNGTTPLLSGFKSKKGQSFQARLKLAAESSGQVSTVFQFPERTPRPARKKHHTSPNSSPSILEP